MDFRQTEKEKVDDFFNENNGNNKVLFAEKYVEQIGDTIVPSWIQEIKKYFNE